MSMPMLVAGAREDLPQSYRTRDYRSDFLRHHTQMHLPRIHTRFPGLDAVAMRMGRVATADSRDTAWCWWWNWQSFPSLG